MNYTAVQQSFAFGEIAPKFHGATGSTIYKAGLMHASRCYFNTAGGIQKATGSELTGVEIPAGLNVRVFAVSGNGSGYVFMISSQSLIVYSAQMEEIAAILESPYADADIPKINIKSADGSVYMVHGSYRPYVVSFVDVEGAPLEETLVETYEFIVESSEGEMLISLLLMDGGFEINHIEFVDGDVDFSEEGMYPSCQSFKSGRWFLGGCAKHPSTIYGSQAPDDSGTPRFSSFLMSDKYTKVITYTSVEVHSGSSIDGETISSYESESAIERVREPGDYAHVTVNKWIKEYASSDEKGNSTFTHQEQWKEYRLTDDVLSSHAIELTETDMDNARILWIENQTRMLVGMSRSIWMDAEGGFTPAGFDLAKTLSLNCSDVEPVTYGPYLFFASASKRRIYAIGYNTDTEGFSALILSDSASHLFTADIIQMAMVDGAMSVLFVLLADGSLLSCSINDSVGYGWSRVPLGDGGKILSISSLPASNRDWLYLAVSSGGSSTLRRMAVRESGDEEGVYLDAYERIPAGDTPSREFKVTHYLPGDIVSCVSGGKYIGDYPVSETGTVSISEPSSELIVGIMYSMAIETLNPELPSNSATSSGKTRQIISQMAYVDSSLDFTVKIKGSHGNPVWVHGDGYGTATYGGKGSEFTGYREVPIVSLTGRYVSERIESSLPYPLNIQSLVTNFTLVEV